MLIFSAIQDDFDDEEEYEFKKSEWEPTSAFGKFVKKALKVLKKVPKIIFISLIILVWVVIFAILAARSNNDIVETPILSDSARQLYDRNPSEFTSYFIHTKEFMNKDGTIQLIDSVYAEDAHELEVGIRIKGYNGQTLYCHIRDEDGKIMKQVFRRTRERNWYLTDSIKFQYVFERISFSDVYIDVSKNIINRVSADMYEDASLFESQLADYSAYVNNDSNVQATGKLYFEIFESPESQTPLFSCVVYDSETPLEEFEYELPDQDYLKG